MIKRAVLFIERAVIWVLKWFRRTKPAPPGYRSLPVSVFRGFGESETPGWQAVVVLVALASRSDRDGIVSVSDQQLAADTRLPPESIKRALVELLRDRPGRGSSIELLGQVPGRSRFRIVNERFMFADKSPASLAHELPSVPDGQ